MLKLILIHLLNSMQITKADLERIYRENKNEKAAKILKVSVPTMLKHLKAAGIRLKGAGGYKKNKLFVI